MASLSSIIFNPNFWIIVNVILFFAIIGLIYRHYKMNRVETTKVENKQLISLDNEINQAHRLVEENRRAEAIVTAFNNVLKVLGAEKHPSKTYRELLSENVLNLDKYSLNLLHEMYGIYERVKFGGSAPSDEDLERFLKNLQLLNRHLMMLEVGQLHDRP